MKTYLNQISGIDDAIVSMFMSKRSWTREKELHIREVCRTVLRPDGGLKDFDATQDEAFAARRMFPGENADDLRHHLFRRALFQNRAVYRVDHGKYRPVIPPRQQRVIRRYHRAAQFFSQPPDKKPMLRKKLNRPVRVCGMVKNQGEPGGGPFIIAEKDGSTSLQILESVQINMADEKARAALASATHFNPVDIVCCLHDYKGQSFNLLEHVDHDAGFISSKSYQGRELKALELPGLWNGSMSDWNTLFVEVPLETFNPVKVVLDLLRPAHQM